MRKALILVACSLILMLAMIAVVSACGAPKPEPAYTGEITENVLSGMNQNDYAKFSQSFDEAVKKPLRSKLLNRRVTLSSPRSVNINQNNS